MGRIAQEEQIQLADVVIVLPDIPPRTEITLEMVEVQQCLNYIHPIM